MAKSRRMEKYPPRVRSLLILLARLHMRRRARRR